MNKLMALIKKEFLLLLRDRIGLAVLFIMPMFFVFSITLLQAHRPNDVQRIPILLMSYDHGQIEQALEENLQQSKNFTIKQIQPANVHNEQQAIKQIANGQYKMLLVIPKDASAMIKNSTKQAMVQSQHPLNTHSIQMIFDPAVSPILRQTMLGQVQAVIRLYQMQAMQDVVSEVLGTPDKNISQQTIPIVTRFAGKQTQIPNAVQQNIPAWALFGMFFIALPLAGVMLKERSQGVLLRLYVAPIAKIWLILSRVIAFMCVNLLQLWLMLLVGIVVMPWFGLPALNLSGHIGPVLVIGIVAAFAATSFGLLVGAWSKTIEQATSFAPIAIVIAAAIGGIMIPTYLMPLSMQHFAQFSPLHWGHVAFIDVLVRHADLRQIAWLLIDLFIFSLVCCLLALWKVSRHPD